METLSPQERAQRIQAVLGAAEPPAPPTRAQRRQMALAVRRQDLKRERQIRVAAEHTRRTTLQLAIHGHAVIHP